MNHVRIAFCCLITLIAFTAAYPSDGPSEVFIRRDLSSDMVVQFVEHLDVASVERFFGEDAKELASSNCFGYTPLMAAARGRKVDMLRWLLAKGAPPAAADGSGMTALHYACEKGDLESARVLLDKGAPVNAAQKKGFTPLHLAAKSGNVALIELLLARGANLNSVVQARYNALGFACMQTNQDAALLLLARGADWRIRAKVGHTPLVHAAWYGQTETVKRMIAKGADINSRGAWAMTPLIAAASGQREETVRFLIDAGADVNARTVDGINALNIAAGRNMTDSVRLLLAKGAKATLVPTYKMDSFGPGVDDERDQSLPLFDGETALMSAISQTNADLELCKLLAAAGVDVNARGVKGRSALWYAANKGHKEIASWLLSNGATDAAIADKRDILAPFHLAARNGHLEVLKLLHPKVGSVDIRTPSESTALMYAAAFGRNDVAKWLLSQNADVNARNKGNATALMAAAAGGHAPMVELLLSRGADPAVKDDARLSREYNIDYFGNVIREIEPPRNAFVHAVVGGHLEAARILARRAPDVNYVCSDRTSLLMRCIRRGWRDLAFLLIERGADVNYKTRLMVPGRPNALFSAVWANDPETVRRLAAAGADIEAKDEHYTWTPLYCAVHFNHFRVVEALLEKGARCDAKVTSDYRPLTPFQLAVYQGQHHILALFLKRPEGRSQINVPFRHMRGLGDGDRVTHHGAGALRTPLSLAMGSLPTVRLLLANGADVRLADADGATPLDSVFMGLWHEEEIGNWYRFAEIKRAAVNDLCRDLLARGADPNGRNGGPLRTAAEGNPQLVRLLLEKGARIEERDTGGNTPLLVALNSARLWPHDPAPAIESALALMAAGADLRAENAAGRTVLTVGLPEWRTVQQISRMAPGSERTQQLSGIEKQYDNSIATFRALLATGKVDIHMRNKAGETVLAYAVREKMNRVAAYLRQAGARY